MFSIEGIRDGASSSIPATRSSRSRSRGSKSRDQAGPRSLASCQSRHRLHGHESKEGRAG